MSSNTASMIRSASPSASYVVAPCQRFMRAARSSRSCGPCPRVARRPDRPARGRAQRRLVLFHHHHRQPRVEQRHGDARAHGAAAHHADALQPARPGPAPARECARSAVRREGVLDGGARHRIRSRPRAAPRPARRWPGRQEVDWGSPAAGPSAWRVPALAWLSWLASPWPSPWPVSSSPGRHRRRQTPGGAAWGWVHGPFETVHALLS